MSWWYRWVRLIVFGTLKLYFRKIRVEGLEHIPSTGPVLFAVNHQNAFLDALLVATNNPRELHFLARADVFKSRLARKFFASLNMMPIYRWRDGRAGLKANHQIFARSHELLDQRHALLMFPEANHHQQRLLLPLSKGFTRITSGIRDSQLMVVPVGLNYSHHRRFGGSVSIYLARPLQQDLTQML
jgi:1-acyl-sn-glycerol-3-phosphate acyltransferase